MKNLTKTIFAVLAAGVISCVLFSQQAHATELTPGNTVLAGAGTGQPPAGATLVASLLNQAFVAGTFSGTVSSWVYSMDPANPHGGLDFVYELHNNTGSQDEIDSLGVGFFAGLLTDVVQNINGATSVSSTGTSRSGGTGNVITWSFMPGGLGAGLDSYFMDVRTDAIFFHQGTVGVNNSTGTTGQALVPGTVPDGGSAVALLGIALAGLEGVRRLIRVRKS